MLRVAPHRPSTPRLRSLAGVLALLLVGCSINPATGNRQLVLIDEAQEIAMGKEADGQITQQLGLYPDDELQGYVAALGRDLASRSERPGLPWTFRVVDDPTVNAFALPGGFIYVTRGILAHLGAEAELAGVLGHEIGHVTARHSVNQMSKGMLAQLGLGVGSAVSPELAGWSGLAQTGLSLLFLKFGRDDERQADELGLRYSARSGFDPRSMIEVFALLGRVGARAGGGGLPSWLATHPQPEARSGEAERALAALDIDFQGLRVEREPFLRHVDGLVYGADPREGYFREQRFLHPGMRFELQFPAGWNTGNLRQAVVAREPAGEAVITLTLAPQSDVETASRAFVEQGVTPGRSFRDRIGGQRAVSYYFSADVESTEIAGLAVFLEHQNRIFRMLGYTTLDRFDAHRERFERSLESFRRVDDPRVVGVEPLRVRVERLERPTTIARLAASRKSPVSVEDLMLLNNVGPDDELARGDWVKVVVGEPPP